LLHYKLLVKVVTSASLAPKRVHQATVDTRDAIFKTYSYIEFQFVKGELAWKLYNDIPAHSIYNMDELGNDMTKH